MNCCILSFGWFPGVWILCTDVSEHSVSSIFIGRVSRNNNLNEIVGVFIGEKVWLEKSLSQSEGGWQGGGGAEDINRLWRSVLVMWGRKGVVSEWGRGAMGWLDRLWRWNRQSVPKRRHIQFRRRRITQKKEYNIHNTAKVWNQKSIDVTDRQLGTLKVRLDDKAVCRSGLDKTDRMIGLLCAVLKVVCYSL